ncbi:protein mono-ADP-ribosyltransferase PARP9 isoform X2 [Girardinichthys multiradiatus]|uniref:protein mono-ADP-ribosyltransferase PARP9 isoform X2 n=1 Tax=Girardinichthys multiradiatus TaxID=208333 RepID=UPI001FAE3DAB|nr:protein mono-ADP-ribosyltransferase PARP9 isoform X2 [Girardinichthys multiradiatus]
MASKLDIPLKDGSVTIVKRYGAILCDIIDTKFGCVTTIKGLELEDESSTSYRRRPPTISPEKRFEFVMRSGVKVSVWKADLTHFHADAVVNAANEDLKHYGGLALALSTAGGPLIQMESDDFVKKRGKLQTGKTVVLDAGSLLYKKIIHAVGPDLSMSPSRYDVQKATPMLEKTIWSILNRVEEHHLADVAIPAISSGLFHYPLPDCARTIVSTVKYYYDNLPFQNHHPKEIFLVNNDEPTVQEMERACREIFSPQQPQTYSQAAWRNTRSAAHIPPPSVQMGNVLLTLKKGKIEEQKAFEREMGDLQRHLASISFPLELTGTGGKFGQNSPQQDSPAHSGGSQGFSRPEASGPKDDSYTSRAPTPTISLLGPSDETTREAEKWLNDLLSVQLQTIENNFISHFSERDHMQLSRLAENGLLIEEFMTQGHACIAISGEMKKDCVVAALKVEAMLCKIQKEFISEEEGELQMLSQTELPPKRDTVDKSSKEFSHQSDAFIVHGLRVTKVDKMENYALKKMFDLKKKQLQCSKPKTMFQRIPAQFCEMISRIGFQAECAPPEDPKYGEGIYFAHKIKVALELWREQSEEYLYFVEAEVLTGNSAPGKRGLNMPPPVGKDPNVTHNSVDGGPDISVIFSGYQALPKFIIICKKDSSVSYL